MKKPKPHFDESNKQAMIIKALRRLAREWQPKKDARKRDEERVLIGKYLNGNDKFKIKGRCAHCDGMFDRKEIDMDHIEPVILPETGFVDYNTLIERMLLPMDQYQSLCKPCHKKKSKLENARRTRGKKS